MRQIQEVIVVEGMHDRDRVLQAVEADVVVTGGARIKKEVFQRLERVAKTRGVIILTDPDYAGEQIRRQIAARFPQSKHAYIPRAKAVKSGDVGVENASAIDILEALLHVRTMWDMPQEWFTWDDMVSYGLVGAPNAAERRERLGAILNIGYGNAKAFHKRILAFQVTREEFAVAMERLDTEVNL